jgi:hypothetical protein
MLNPKAQHQQSYFENSFALKEILDSMEILPNTKIFSCNAKSMYMNIPTAPALEVVGQYICDHCHPNLAKALIKALTILMENKIIQFGDTFWKQIAGTTMGISPAPPWAILFFAIHELVFVEKWKEYLAYFRNGSLMMALASGNYMPILQPTWHFGPNSCRMSIPTTQFGMGLHTT